MSPSWGYSFEEEKYDSELLAKAAGRDLRIKPKHAREVCDVIKGMYLDEAKSLLEKVIKMEQSVPFRRHNKKLAHKKDLKKYNWDAGRYPRKAAARIYEILSQVEANAEYRGLDVDLCRIIHAAAQRGRKIKRYIERAYGRSSPYYKTLTHVEIVVYEILS